MDETIDRTESIFAAAVALPVTAERAALLDRECANDPGLRGRIEALLRAHDRAGHLLDRPVPGGPEQTRGYVPGEQPGAVIAGRYKLLEAIGEGGMGTVWVAEQSEPVRRKVALKLIKAGMDSRTVLARFEAERQALAVMDHPNIAKVLDGGLTETGRPFFVMEYVKGMPITEYCDATRLSVADRLKLFVQVCQAVQHAHQKGIIHRDLKPSNILVAPYDDRPIPKVIDFGLAKAMHQSLTERTLHTAHETVLGTPLYMSPEQAQLNNIDVDTRSDIYSLGVLLYELLTGTTPLEKQRLKEAAWDEVKRIIREEDPPRPSIRLSSAQTLPSLAASRQTEPVRLTKIVRRELDWIVMKSLEKDRSRRYETAAGFAADIERYLAGEPVVAHPPSARYWLRKMAGRYRLQVIAASLVLLALLGGITGTTWGLIKANRAAEAERLARNEAVEQTRLAKEAAGHERQARAREAERADGERYAKQEAEEKKAEAERNLAFAKKGNEILGSVFAGLDPRKIAESGRPLQDVLRENLVTAARELEGSAIGDPLEVTWMQHKLGMSLIGLGEYGPAVEVLGKALQTCQTNLAPDDPRTLATMDGLAHAYHAAGQLDKALPLYEEALRLLRANPGPDHPRTLTGMNNLAVCYKVDGQLDKALPLFEEALPLLRAKLGPDHPDTLSTLMNLAHAYEGGGQPDKALPLLEEGHRLLRAKLGPDHPDAIAGIIGLGHGYLFAGQHDKAVPLFEEGLRLAKAKLGPDHPHAISSMTNLAVSFWAIERLDLSIPLFEEALKLGERRQGRQHPSTLMDVANLGANYKDAGRLDEAIPLLEEAYAASEKHPRLRWVAVHLLDAYAQTGRPAEDATRLLAPMLADIRRPLSKDSPQLAWQLAYISHFLLRVKAAAEAEPLLRECLAIREQKEPDAWTTFNTQSLLGWALLGQEKHAEAEPLLLKGYEGMKAREEMIPQQGLVRIPEAIDRLIELYAATDKPDEVQKWQAERAKYPPPAAAATEEK